MVAATTVVATTTAIEPDQRIASSVECKKPPCKGGFLLPCVNLPPTVQV